MSGTRQAMHESQRLTATLHSQATRPTSKIHRHRKAPTTRSGMQPVPQPCTIMPPTHHVKLTLSLPPRPAPARYASASAGPAYEAAMTEALTCYVPSLETSPTAWLYSAVWRYTFAAPLAQHALRVAAGGVDYAGQVHPLLACVLITLHEGGMLTRRRYEQVVADVRLNAEIWKVGGGRGGDQHCLRAWLAGSSAVGRCAWARLAH
jgi:hypothetical protein